MRPDRTALVDHIVADGERRRRRRRALLSGVAALLVGAAVALPLALGDDEPTEAVVADDGGGPSPRPPGDDDDGDGTSTVPTTLVEPTDPCAPTCPTPTSAPGTVSPDGTVEAEPVPPTASPPTIAPSTTVPGTTTTDPTRTPPPPQQCRNSHDPRCGPFSWQPEPAPDQRLVLTLTADRQVVRVGQPVVFTATATDGDSPPAICGLSPDTTVERRGCIYQTCAEEERFGQWTPPDPQPGEDTEQRTHTYTAPGTYMALVAATSAVGCGGPGSYNPYGEETSTTIEITVTP